VLLSSGPLALTAAEFTGVMGGLYARPGDIEFGNLRWDGRDHTAEEGRELDHRRVQALPENDVAVVGASVQCRMGCVIYELRENLRATIEVSSGVVD